MTIFAEQLNVVPILIFFQLNTYNCVCALSIGLLRIRHNDLLKFTWDSSFIDIKNVINDCMGTATMLLCGVEKQKIACLLSNIQTKTYTQTITEFLYIYRHSVIHTDWPLNWAHHQTFIRDTNGNQNWKSMNQFLMLRKVYFIMIANDCKTNSATHCAALLIDDKQFNKIFAKKWHRKHGER